MADMTINLVSRDVVQEANRQLCSIVGFAMWTVRYIDEIYFVRDIISNQLWMEASDVASVL